MLQSGLWKWSSTAAAQPQISVKDVKLHLQEFSSKGSAGHSIKKNKSMLQICFLKFKATHLREKSLWHKLLELLILKPTSVMGCNLKLKEKEVLGFCSYFVPCRTVVCVPSQSPQWKQHEEWLPRAEKITAFRKLHKIPSVFMNIHHQT